MGLILSSCVKDSMVFLQTLTAFWGVWLDLQHIWAECIATPWGCV